MQGPVGGEKSGAKCPEGEYSGGEFSGGEFSEGENSCYPIFQLTAIKYVKGPTVAPPSLMT